jgi:hypothetical protein
MAGDTANPEDLSYLGSHVQQLVANQELRASVQQPKVLPGARQHKLDALARGKRVQVNKQVCDTPTAGNSGWRVCIGHVNLGHVLGVIPACSSLAAAYDRRIR